MFLRLCGYLPEVGRTVADCFDDWRGAKHRDLKTVMRYDHSRENLEQNAVNFLQYEEER